MQGRDGRATRAFAHLNRRELLARSLMIAAAITQHSLGSMNGVLSLRSSPAAARSDAGRFLAREAPATARSDAGRAVLIRHLGGSRPPPRRQRRFEGRLSLDLAGRAVIVVAAVA